MRPHSGLVQVAWDVGARSRRRARPDPLDCLVPVAGAPGASLARLLGLVGDLGCLAIGRRLKNDFPPKRAALVRVPLPLKCFSFAVS